MEPNAILASRYRIDRELGEGGMGTVYLATDMQTDHHVAIKRLKTEVAEPALIERFRREGEALRDLNHPNIVKLLDTLSDAGEHYLVMEYVSGGSLADWLTQQKPDSQQIVRYALDLADALTRAHKLDIIHRDLKPANILIADDGTLRLTDFGIAQLGSKERVTDTDVIIGTIDYLPPEAFDGTGIDARSDIWAFGVVMFELIAGERPFSANTLIETLQKITIAPLPDLESLNPNVPVALIDLVYRMLERDPNNRIPSVRHIGAELEDILHGRASKQPITKRFDESKSQLTITRKHNLPAQTTPFVGREAEVQAVVDLLNQPSNRLVTILGSGGMGKTRLSLAVAEVMLARYDDGVFFVELAPALDRENILPAIAEQLNYQFETEQETLLQQLVSFLDEKSILLVLDNYEHLIDGATLPTELLKQARNLNILVTSRQRLNQIGETVYDLLGMSFSDWQSPESALEHGAGQLFLQSAKRVRPDFELTHDDLSAVTKICRIVQGMPLGIILAASWLSMLTPEEIADELSQGLALLETDASDIPERQRSINAVFDYTWEHLTPQEQSVFMKLSVFRGGFTRESAQAVAGGNLRTLMSLMNKSLLRRNNETGRYEIHELLRQYAHQHLSAHKLADDAQKAFVAYFVQLGISAEKELRYAKQEYWFKTIADELDNLRAVFEWSLERDGVDAITVLSDTRDFWFYQGMHVEAHTWYTRLQDKAEQLPPVLWARLLYGKSIISWALQKVDEAEQLARESIVLLETLDAPKYLAWAYIMLASVTGVREGKYQETLELCNIAEKLLKSIDDKAGLAQLYNIEGNAHEFAQDYPRAIEACQKSIDVAEETGEQRRVAMNLGNIARLKIEAGDYADGLRLLKEAMRLNFKLGFQYMLVFDMHAFAALLANLGRYDEAVVMLSVGHVLSEQINIKVQPADQVGVTRTINLIRENLDDDLYERAWHRGQDMTFSQAMAYALDLDTEV